MTEMVCIVCPNGCRLRITGEGEAIRVEGQQCKRGIQFAMEELSAPKRTIASTVRTAFPDCPVLPVRVSAEIPKERIFDVMRAINAVCVNTRVGRGDTIIANVLNLGVDVIATSNLMKE